MKANHTDAMHFDPCQICEKVFVGSMEKRAHIATNHDDSNTSEEEFTINKERQSTLKNSEFQFIGEVPHKINDNKKSRMGGKVIDYLK